MTQRIGKIGEVEVVASGKQLGRLGAPAGKGELLTHLTHHQAHDEIRHDATRFEPQSLCCGRSKLSITQRVGTDSIDRSTQSLGRQGKLYYGSQLVSSYPTDPLLALPCLKTHIL